MTRPSRTLVVLAHPSLPTSRLNTAMTGALAHVHDVHVHDLHADWAGEATDTAAQQQLVEAHDRILFQFPLTWYSCPHRLSEWLATVWTRGWAYGPGGRALNFKTFGVAVTTGSHRRDYTPEGRYHRTLDDVLVPFELLARHSGMHYLPPFAITGAREISDQALADQATSYREHVRFARPAIVFDGRDDERARTVYTRPTGQPRSA